MGFLTESQPAESGEEEPAEPAGEDRPIAGVETERYMVDINPSRRYRLSAKMLKLSGAKRDKTSPRWFIRPADRDAFMDLAMVVHYGGVVTDSSGQDVSTDRLRMLAQQYPAIIDW